MTDSDFLVLHNKLKRIEDNTIEIKNYLKALIPQIKGASIDLSKNVSWFKGSVDKELLRKVLKQNKLVKK